MNLVRYFRGGGGGGGMIVGHILLGGSGSMPPKKNYTERDSDEDLLQLMDLIIYSDTIHTETPTRWSR